MAGSIESLTDPFVWKDRTANDWQKQVKEKEAARLFYLVSEKAGFTRYFDNPLLSQKVITDFGLQTAFRTFWQDDPLTLDASVQEVRKMDKKQEFKDPDLMEEWVGRLNSVFGSHDMYIFLLASRLARFRLIYERKRGLPAQSFNEKRREVLGWPDEKLGECQKSYQQIIECFYPYVINQFRERIPRNSDFDEKVAIAQETLSSSVINFYWETYGLDPKWTVERFLRSTFTSIYKATKDFGEEKSQDEPTLYNLKAVESTEDDAIESLTVDPLSRITNKISNLPYRRAAEILIKHEIKSIRGLAKQAGIGRVAARQVFLRLKNVLSGNEEDFDLSNSPKGTYWERFVIDRERQRKAIEKIIPQLPKGRRRILQAFYEASATAADWQTVLNQVKEQLPSLQMSTINRHIRSGLKAVFDNVDLYKNSVRTTPLRHHQRYLTLMNLSKNEEFWAQVNANPSLREMIVTVQLTYPDKDTKISGDIVGKVLGVHSVTVYKRLAKFDRLVNKQFS